jgi:sugar lactone lactonase YvrE
VYVADSNNQRIRKVDPSGVISTVAGTGAIINGIGQGTYGGDGGLATSAMLNFPDSVAVDSAGNLYIADTSNYRIRRVDKNTGIITTVAGNGNVPQNKSTAGDGGAATQTAIQQPNSVAVDSAGNIYFSSIGRVQRVDSNGIIRTVAGDGTQGDTGDGGLGTSAEVKAFRLWPQVIWEASISRSPRIAFATWMPPESSRR